MAVVRRIVLWRVILGSSLLGRILLGRPMQPFRPLLELLHLDLQAEASPRASLVNCYLQASLDNLTNEECEEDDVDVTLGMKVKTVPNALEKPR
jgi:hypothetical protein